MTDVCLCAKHFACTSGGMQSTWQVQHRQDTVLPAKLFFENVQITAEKGFFWRPHPRLQKLICFYKLKFVNLLDHLIKFNAV